jgi:hypothetical protein
MLHLLLISWLTALPGQALVSGRSFESPPLAREVVRLIENRALDGFAVTDESRPGLIVAALLAGNRLLVVEARPPMPAAIEKALQARRYRAVFARLRRPDVLDTFFVRDVGRDGLLAHNQGSADVVVADGQRRTFDGDRGEHDLSGAEYNQWFEAVDTRYAHALTVLAQALQRTTSIG